MTARARDRTPRRGRMRRRYHSAVWKIAYADFVTAMMAFFLLLWLVNTSSPDQKRGIADYFAPPQLSATQGGYGGLLAGRSATSEGPVAGDGQPPVEVRPRDPVAPVGAPERADGARPGEGPAMREARLAETTLAALSSALADVPEIAGGDGAIAIVEDARGVRLDLAPPGGAAMFAPGASQPTEAGRNLLAHLAGVLRRLPNRVVVMGHAAAGEPSAWALSAVRADHARRALIAAGLASSRIVEVSALGDSDPRVPGTPSGQADARIGLLLLTDPPLLPPGAALFAPAD
ncbi:MAG: flagellar motor protein MotB [Alphaproteobacteria bacterium]|nr:flagellar motor protein MotB [Alphaproteobacteria bacterium]MDX5368155.1 flagellar motor protein MotB [Alphaproteobacteria bacterium]MDX5462986.1 flagellar motor protein MotB [Alphaproteobacteria bacterium]